MLAVPFHGARQHLAFRVAPNGSEILNRAAVVHAGHVLLDDRAFVEIGCDVVRRSANELDAAVVRLVVGPRALETGQEAVMDVDHPAGKLLAHAITQNLHVPRQHDQFRPFATDDFRDAFF